MELMREDPLNLMRELPPEPGTNAAVSYVRAFEKIRQNPDSLLLVAESAGEIVGTVQLQFFCTLARNGALRAQIEALRIRSDKQGQGIGSALIAWSVDYARRKGCRMVQVTTDLKRDRAKSFYVRLGFSLSHAGFKLDIR